MIRPRDAGFAIPWLFAGLGGWLGYQLLLQNGRVLLRVEALEARLEELQRNGLPAQEPLPPEGLPKGTVLQDFELVDLKGTSHTLSKWRGQRILLIFFDPSCPFCNQMLPEFAALPEELHALPVFISTGDVAENRDLFTRHAIRFPVLLQEHMEVAHLNGVSGTPMGYLVDEQGHTASPLIAGAASLLALLGGPRLEAAIGNGHVLRTITKRPLSSSQLLRDGLNAGVTAPEFSLPALGGGEIALSTYRGSRVLLIFSDPHCGPCDELAPELERFHRRATGTHVLMVSRGTVEANLAKIEEFGLTFPVVLQRHWEISRAYGMFATPIGYLINEEGIIASDVAIGNEAILALADRQAPGVFQP